MPEWLIPILQQFPIVALIGVVVWYAEQRVSAKEIRLEERADKQLKELHDREEQLRKEVRDDRDAEIKRFQDSQKTIQEKDQQLLAVKDTQIASLTKEVEEMRKEVAKLTKKIQG